MQRTRGNNRGPAYEEWVAERAKEVQEEQRLQAEAQANADAQNPELQFKRAADAEAQTILELLRTGYVPESVLPGAERMNGRVISNQQAAINNWKYFATTCPTFQIWMGRQLLDASERSDLSPIAPNYQKLHELMLQYGAYIEPVVEQPVAQPEVEPTSRIAQWKPSEQFKVEQANLDKVFAVVDGVEISERYLNSLPSREELKIRRKLEKGHAGNQNFDTFLEIKDAQFERDAEIARRAREDER
jgi:hypothetical protein